MASARRSTSLSGTSDTLVWTRKWLVTANFDCGQLLPCTFISSRSKKKRRRLKEDLRNRFEHSQHWSDGVWKSKMAGGGGNKKRFQYCTDPSGQEILYLRALHGHCGRNFIDSPLKIDSKRFLPAHLSCRMCKQFTLHHEFRIDTGRTKF